MWRKKAKVIIPRTECSSKSIYNPSSLHLYNLTNQRLNCCLRFRNRVRQPDKLANGVTDHLGRDQMGNWLEYEDVNDP